VGRCRGDIAGHDIRLDPEHIYFLRRIAVMDGVERPEQLPGTLLIAELGEGESDPNSGMGIMAAVFSNPGGIRFDIAGLESRGIERGVEDHDERVLGKVKSLEDGFHGPPGSEGLPGPRDHGPALREGIDLAFRIGDGAECPAIVEKGPEVPPAVPSLGLGTLTDRLGLLPAGVGEPPVPPGVRQLGESAEDVEEEPGQPDALPAPAAPDQVQPVVPIAAADERQTMGTEGQATLDRPGAVLVDGAHFVRALPEVEAGILPRIEGPPLEKRPLFVQNCGVSGSPNVPADGIWQP
jgi:hypothetical protein